MSSPPRRVLLSDGLVNGTTPSEVKVLAEPLRRAGVAIHSIGLGDTIDRELLRSLAGERGDYLEAPDAEALAAIYAGLAERLACPPEASWGRR